MVNSNIKVSFRSAYIPKRVSIGSGDEPSRTKQSFQSECDINNIMKKYEKTGLIDHVQNITGQFADCSNVLDYHAAVNFVQDAYDNFMGLPSVVRARFKNDPAQFYDFVNNPANLDEMVELGLVVRPDVSPVQQQTTTPADASPKAGEAVVVGAPTAS